MRGGVLLVLVMTASAAAMPPPEPEEASTTLIEWSTWLRGGIVFAANGTSESGAARETMPPVDGTDHDDHDIAAVGAAGAGFTVPLHRRLRVGPFAELRERGGVLFGGELTVLGEEGGLDLFQYGGTAAVSLRAGMNEALRSAQLNVSYRAPWDLWGSQPRAHRYIIGASIVMALAQSRTDPSDWSMTWGIEFEPVGALRYLLGIRSWY